MKDLLIKIKNFSIITIIASFVIGLVLLIWPYESITAVSILTGVTTILLGVTAWISYFASASTIGGSIFLNSSLISLATLLT